MSEDDKSHEELEQEGRDTARDEGEIMTKNGSLGGVRYRDSLERILAAVGKRTFVDNVRAPSIDRVPSATTGTGVARRVVLGPLSADDGTDDQWHVGYVSELRKLMEAKHEHPEILLATGNLHAAREELTRAEDRVREARRALAAALDVHVEVVARIRNLVVGEK